MNASVSLHKNEHGYWFVRIQASDNGLVQYVPITLLAFSRLHRAGYPVYTPKD